MPNNNNSITTSNYSSVDTALDWISNKIVDISNSFEINAGTQALVNSLNVKENYKIIYQKLENSNSNSEWSVTISAASGAVVEAFTAAGLKYATDRVVGVLTKPLGAMLPEKFDVFFDAVDQDGKLNAAYAYAGETAGMGVANGMSKLLEKVEERFNFDINKDLFLSTPIETSNTPSTLEISQTKSPSTNKTNINIKSDNLNQEETINSSKSLLKFESPGSDITIESTDGIINTTLLNDQVVSSANSLLKDNLNLNSPGVIKISDSNDQNGNGSNLYLLEKETRLTLKDNTTGTIDSILSSIKSGTSSLIGFINHQIEGIFEPIFKELFSTDDSTKDANGDNAAERLAGKILADLIEGKDITEIAEDQVNSILIQNLLKDASAKLAAAIPTGPLGADTAAFVQGTVAGAIINFAIAVAADHRMDSDEYGEAAAKALTSTALYNKLGGGAQGAGVVAAAISLYDSFKADHSMNSDQYEDAATSAAAAYASAYAGYTLGNFLAGALSEFGPVGMVAGYAIGYLIGYLLYVPIKNGVSDAWDGTKEVYDALEDLFAKGEITNDVRENLKEILRGLDDAVFSNSGRFVKDFAIGAYNLFGGHYGQTYNPGEYGDPSLIYKQLYQINTKADGTGLEIIGVGSEGVTLKASQSGVDDIYGSNSSDSLVGNDQNNVIIGSSLNDNGVDNDIIEGKGGDDIILGKAGNDHIEGGDGNDTIDGGTGNDRIIGGNGNDQIIGGDGDDIIEGNNGDDQIDSGNGDDTVIAGDGNDTIISGSGSDNIDAGAGDDVIFSENDNDLIRAGAGSDQINSGDGDDEIYGEDGNDNITSEAGDDIIFAGSGVDIINSGLGNDIVDGGADNDLVLAGLGNDVVYGNDGDDTISGELGNDYLMGGAGDDIIDGGEGDDILIGNTGNDVLKGGAGNDLYLYNKFDGATEINEEQNSSNNDVLRIFGIANTNELVFSKDNDDLVINFTSSPNDRITVKNQFNSGVIEKLRIDNGTEIDLTSLNFNSGLASYNQSTYNEAVDSSKLQQHFNNLLQDKDNQVIYNPNSSWYSNNYDLNTINQQIDYTKYNEVEVRSYKAKRSIFGGYYNVYYKYYETNLSGTALNDKIVGSWWGENIYGGAGNDQLYGGDGNDAIYGGDDNDLIYGGTGNDVLHGQNGTDKVYGDENDDKIEGNNGNDTLYGDSGNDTIAGADGDDLIFGGKGQDYINGGSGHDLAFGGDNSDMIEGEAGNDYLYGEEGDDIIGGGDGDDVVNGGNGDDYLDGGKGNDVIKGGDGMDNINGGDGDDIIDGGRGDDMIIDSLGNDQITLGDGADVLITETSLLGSKTIKDFNGNYDKIIIRDLGISFSTALSYLSQQGSNVWFAYNGYKIIFENTLLSTINEDNLIFAQNGDSGNNFLQGNQYSNAIFGMDGDDILHGDGSSDFLWGGNGKDQLYGEDGNDRLFYNIDAYWKKTILNYAWGSQIKNGVTINPYTGQRYDLTGNTRSYDLFDGGNDTDTLLLSEKSDTILLDAAVEQTTFNGVNISNIAYSDKEGTVKDIEIIYAFGGDDVINLSSNTKQYSDITIYGGSGNDTIWTNTGSDRLYGGDGNDNIQAAGGDDIIYGEADNDYLDGGDGDDTIYGGSGDDKIYGQKGNDVMKSGSGNDLSDGGSGNDTYFYDRGDGNDVISDSGVDALDKIEMGENINKANVILRKEGNDLRVVFSNSTSDSILIKNQYYYDSRMVESEQYYRIEKIVFNNGDEIALTGSTTFTYQDSAEVIYGSHMINDVIYAKAGNDTVYAASGNDTVYGEVGADTIYGEAGNDTIYGGNDNDSLWGGDGADMLYGESGVDYLMGGIGDDILNGGTGNDTLTGDIGNDTYLFNVGDGSDTIRERSVGGSDPLDMIKFGAGITQSDLLFRREGDDLIINFKNTPTDQIRIAYQFYGEITHFIEKIQFNDNSEIDLRSALPISGTDGAETIYGHFMYGTVIDAKAGNDTVYGGSGNDTLNGGSGNDNLIGNAGNDTIIGGSGNDTLTGDIGNDTYLFNIGDGSDTIRERSVGGSDPLDMIKFGAGITQSDLLFRREGDDLIINFKNTPTDQIRIAYQFYGEITHFVEKIQFADNSEIDLRSALPISGTDNAETIYGHFMYGTVIDAKAGNDTVYGGSGNDTLNGGAGSDYLNGRSGDDILNGGDGNDTIYGEVGNDIIIGGTGNDYLDGAQGNDTYQFNLSDGSDTIADSYDAVYSQADKIKLGAGITQNDIILKRSGNDLYISFKNNSSDLIRVMNQFYYDGYTAEESQHHRIESIEFNDGGSISLATNGNVKFDYTDNAETIYGAYHTNDTIYAKGGNDTVYGLNGNDIIYGGDGNDYLDGGIGDDKLNGGNGIDQLLGGAGRDIFTFDSLGSSTNQSLDLIMDFVRGQDHIDLSALSSIHSIADLTITNNGSTTLIDDKNSDFAVKLSGVQLLSADDFYFA